MFKMEIEKPSGLSKFRRDSLQNLQFVIIKFSFVLDSWIILEWLEPIASNFGYSYIKDQL